MHRKLAHDRSIHAQELNNLYEEAVGLVGGSAYTALLARMVSDRKKYNERKTLLDAAQWQHVESVVKDNKLTPMLRAGAVIKKKRDI